MTFLQFCKPQCYVPGKHWQNLAASQNRFFHHGHHAVFDKFTLSKRSAVLSKQCCHLIVHLWHFPLTLGLLKIAAVTTLVSTCFNFSPRSIPVIFVHISMFYLVMSLNIELFKNGLLANEADTIVAHFSEKIVQFPLKASALAVNFPFFIHCRHFRNWLERVTQGHAARPGRLLTYVRAKNKTNKHTKKIKINQLKSH